MVASMESELKLDLDIQRSSCEFDELIAEDVAAEFLSIKSVVRTEAIEMLDRTDYLRNMSVEGILSRPETLLALRMVCIPPLTKDRLSGLSGVSVKRLCLLEEGSLPPRPTGRMKLQHTEAPAIMKAVERRIDSSLAPWVAEGREPKEAEIARLLDVVSDRAAVMSDAFNVPKRSLERRIEADVEEWLRANGYVGFARTDGPNSVELTPGSYGHSVSGLMMPNGEAVLTDFAVAPKNGSNLAYIDIKQSSNAVYALRTRKDTDAAADRVISEYGGRYVLVLCGHFDIAYVKYQRSCGKDIVWHHDLDGLRDLGL